MAFAWLVVTAAAMCPQKAYSDVLWVDNPQSYSVNCFGVNTVKIKVPVYNKDGYDEWIDYGNIYYKVKGGSQDKVLMLYWAAGEEDISGSQKDLPVKFRTNAPGHLNVIRGSGGSSITSEEKTYRLSFNGSDKLYAEVEWTVPIELRGQTIIVSWDVQRDGNMRYEQEVDIDDKEVSIPAKSGLVDPIISEAIISDNPDYYGQLVVPWMITINNDSVVSSVMRYKDKNSQWQERTLETKATGYIYLDASEPHDSLHVIVNYKDDGDLITNRVSNYYDVPVIHTPFNLKATAMNDGRATVKLEWEIHDKESKEYMASDLFQLQRSLSGREEDFADIASVALDLSQDKYTYEDETLLSDIKSQDLDENGHIKTTYRIRRYVTSIWGWVSNPLSKTDSVQFCDVSLLTVNHAQGDWHNKEEHTVKVTWDYEQGTDQQWYVWDKRAEMRLTVKMYRRDGTYVDTQEYVLTPEEIEKKTKVITLNRSCVNYDIYIVTDSKEFPLVNNVKMMEIGSTEDWLTFRSLVSQDKQVRATLTNDLELHNTGMFVGSADHPFTGVLDGNGHKLILVDNFNGGPFPHAKDAIFRNLCIEGTVNGSRVGGFVDEGDNIMFQNCRSMISSTNHNEMGDFIYYGEKIRFQNCLSSCDITNPRNNYSGFIRQARFPEEAECLVYSNVVYAPVHPYALETPFGGLSTHQTRQKEQLKTCYVLPKESDLEDYYSIVNILPKTANDQLALLGDQWQAIEEWPYIAPAILKDTSGDVQEFIVETPIFYFSSNGKVKKGSLNAETRQSSVMLTWEIEGGVVDYFQVKRREVGKSDWDIIANGITEFGYEDTSVSPIIPAYEYLVLSAVDCEGTQFEESNIAEGHCKNTGKLEGYVRYKDGTGVPGVKVMASSEQGGEPYYATTDDMGHFEIDLLPYFGQTSVTYTVTPLGFGNGSEGIDLEEGAKSFDITFNDLTNYSTVPDFTVTSSYVFSGVVLYDGTSIPVKGANFMVNGHMVNTSQGKPLETDYEGKYSFHVYKGSNKIQVVKDGHTFWQDGWFKGETGREDGYNFTDNVADIYFYDQTKVKLIGRVAGGHVQGELPLDNSLSHNNLGDTITIVLVLEGDNKSRLVYDNIDPLKSVVDTTFIHPSHDPAHVYQTQMTTTRRSVTIHPDPYTGEYSVLLPPVKWKVQQIYATGYPTLFPEGKSSDIIDLTDALTPIHETYEGLWQTCGGNEVTKVDVEYNAKYNRIWHAPTELSYEQLGFNQFGYYGDATYTSANLLGEKAEVPLAYMIDPNGPKKASNVAYTFGYPVFSVERQYPFRLSAIEKYYWNNKQNSDSVDVVHLSGGKVTIHNGFISSTHTEEVVLDSIGQALVPIKAAQVPYLLTQEEALRTLTMTLTMDGTTFEAKPLKAYIMNVFLLPGASDIISTGQPMLVDILRDPPGGGSSAKLSKGSTLKKDYTLDLSASIGLKFSIKNGVSEDCYTGLVVAPNGWGTVYGFIHGAETNYETSLDFIIDVKGNRGFSYTMTTNHDITTSSNPYMVGADADVYIGINQDLVLRAASAIRAIPQSQYDQLGGRIASGRMLVLAKGTDSRDSVFYLVRDESVTAGPRFNSTFTYTQGYIINTVIPDLTKQCKDLIFTGSMADAQSLADKNNKLVYLSLVDKDDPRFGIMNQVDGEYVSYTSLDGDREGMNYRIILPSGYDKSAVRDSIYELNQTILTWMSMITQNEREKLSATDLVNTFDVSGGSGMSYSETFTSSYSNTIGYHIPIVSSFIDPYIGQGEYGEAETLVGVFGPFVANLIGNWDKMSHSHGKIESNPEQPSEYEVKVNFTGSKLMFKMTPVFSYDVKHNTTESQSYSRQESFNISMDTNSHLNFSVYRANTTVPEGTNGSEYDVFTSENFYDLVDYNKEFLDRHFEPDDWKYAKSFVYRTNGGATLRPYEPARKTKLYLPGQILDQATKQIEKPVIKLDKQSVSGVPYGEPARFKVYMANESEAPESVYPTLTLMLLDRSNPYGAKLSLDGYVFGFSGTKVAITPGDITEKTLEILPGEGFDYEGLTLRLRSDEDINVYDDVTFDVHFLHTAGSVNISSPDDKWVMNTESPHDKDGYHIPVVIDGFDKNQHNFDHIEFQYKESNRGESYWTNLCSFYANDSLYNEASGVKAMIPENGNITTEFYGEGEVIEKAYDLRAVLFCRHGNEFITTPSKVLSGVKDTRRPQLFGNPEPVSGILNIGDNIVFNFSEDIENNYLDHVVNFEVKGEVNNDNVVEDVSLQFDGNSSMETEARRNFNGKDVTIDMLIKPDNTGVHMPLFSHGTNGKKLQLWITDNKKLKAVVNDQEFVTDSVIRSKEFTQVAMVISQPKGDEEKWKLALYNGGLRMGTYELDEPYTGVGPLIFGRTNEADRSQSSFYKGRMMEARLWYRALTEAEASTIYGGKRLTGYEMGLVDYYPMNEGSGDFALDKTQGANAILYNTSWAMPHGMSLHLEFENHGLALSDKAITRTSEEDYTLMFWFKTNSEGRGTLISNGAGMSSNIGAKNQYCIGFEAEKLMYRSNDMAVEVPGDFSDNDWHHFALTVNRGQRVGSIYIDAILRATFATDTLGGISGGFPMLGGAMYSEMRDGKPVTLDTRNWLSGNLDEICFFAQSLPPLLIKNFMTKSPYGDEAGLLTYISFDRQERQKDNDLIYVPYVYSRRIYKDDDGNIIYERDKETNLPTTTPKRDFPFADSLTEKQVLALLDQAQGAPMRPYEELRNLKFNHVGRNNQILVNINEPDSKINKRNIYVTLRDIPDKNGNETASPITAYFFVDCSPLRWKENRVSKTVQAGEDSNFLLGIENNSGTKHTYKIENCPRWLTFEHYSNVISPNSNEEIDAVVSKNLNVGSYDEVIYLTDENGMTEPLYLTVTVEGKEPKWSVSGDILQHSMNIIGEVTINDEIDTDTRDIVGVFDSDGICHGVANIDYSELTGESRVYLTVYDKDDGSTSDEPFFFKLWNHATGLEMVLKLDNPITFKKSEIIGADKPVSMKAGVEFVQNFNLKSGWNWVSFNVSNEKLFDLNNLLDGLPWQPNDILTDMNSDVILVYKNGHWRVSGDVNELGLSIKRAYAVKVHDDISFPIAGAIIKEVDNRTIRVDQGWNGIGYTPMMNLSVETALADYYDKAEDGDVIKSHTAFAVFQKPNGTDSPGRWKGDLKYMKPGEGYMLLRKRSGKASFIYPFFEPGSRFLDEAALAPANHLNQDYPHTMSLSAVAEGVTVEPGDRLLAYADGELRGISELGADSVFYVSVGGDNRQPLSFTIEREGEVIAATSEVLMYETNAVIGTPDTPAHIDFVRRDIPQYGWYTLDGIKLNKRPVKKGVYIYNGKKKVIE